MTANDLLLISNENQVTTKEILAQCELDAKNGRVESCFLKHFPIDIVSELANNGFRVSQTKGNMGEKIFIVSWL